MGSLGRGAPPPPPADPPAARGVTDGWGLLLWLWLCGEFGWLCSAAPFASAEEPPAVLPDSGAALPAPLSRPSAAPASASAALAFSGHSTTETPTKTS